ncbi:Uncharacterised protein [Streptococcus pneumoniae]|nr:Uncharacterised protein [Streptococcus pneumoniae]
MISFLLLLVLVWGFYIGLSERPALTGLLPDFSHGIGFYGWPVL